MFYFPNFALIMLPNSAHYAQWSNLCLALRVWMWKLNFLLNCAFSDATEATLYGLKWPLCFCSDIGASSEAC